MEIINALIVGIVLGLAIGFVMANKKKQELAAKSETLNADLKATTAKLEMVNKQLSDNERKMSIAMEEAKKETKQLLDENNNSWAQRMKAAKEDAEKTYDNAIKTQQERFDESMRTMSDHLKVATDEILKKRQQELTDASNTNLGQIVNPLRETIDKMKMAMNENTLKQTSMSSEMKTNIEYMIKQSVAAKESADELTRVFKHGTKVQGDWGETILNELLESQGLTNGVHYDTQAVIRDNNGAVVKNDDGGIMRPDVIMHLDKEREIIIDSKVSLTAFIDYVNAETEADRNLYLKNHIASIQKHVEELSKKDYSSYIQPPKLKMDYVIMFVPNIGALWTALNAQPDLWRKAMEKNVFIADEQTLFAALRIINMTWTQIVQAQNHKEVFELANQMIERVGIFLKKYQAIGKALEQAKISYDDGLKKLNPSGQSILQTCSKLEKLGAKQSIKNPLISQDDYDKL